MMKHHWTCPMADLHGLMHDPPRPVDLILLAGDICPDRHQFPDQTMDRAEGQARYLDGPFRAWLARQDCAVVAVWGNHDYIGDRPDLFPAGLPLTVLNDSGCEAAGLSIWGSPWTFSTGALQCGSDDELAEHWRKIPDGIDVLITHQPPAGFCDEATRDNKHLASSSLRREVLQRVRPRLHVFGHLHHGRGHWQAGRTLFVNCTLGNHNGRTSDYPPWGLCDSSWYALTNDGVSA